MRQTLEAAERALVSLGACDDPGCKEPNCEHALVLVRAALGNGGAMSESKIREAARRVVDTYKASAGYVSGYEVQDLEAALDAPEEEVPEEEIRLFVASVDRQVEAWGQQVNPIDVVLARFLRSRFPAAFEEVK